MVERNPWLTIIGIGEDGPAGLSPASRAALERAEIIFGAPRHLSLLPPMTCAVEPWPVPFEAGIAALLARRGTPVVMLASGDPFWFGAGGTIARNLSPDEWIAHPAPGTFSIAASRLGWRLEETLCLGLHAVPITRLRPHLSPGAQMILLVRDGDAALSIARYLSDQGFGPSQITVLEALGGPRERIRSAAADALCFDDIVHPVALAIEVAGDGETLSRASGIADRWFAHDGQMTKRAARALTLSALAPRPGELLWDIGAGSGSVAIEWLLCHASTQALAFERDSERAARARANATALGVDRLSVIEGSAPDILTDQPAPDAVFIGGGLNQPLLDCLFERLSPGTRLVANAVTLESETLLTGAQAAYGGELMRIDLSYAAPLGTRRGWRSGYPLVQWSVTL